MSSLPLNIDWQQILLHAFNFVILAGGLYFLLYQPVKAFMDKRTGYYRSLEEEAKQKLAEAERVKEDYEKRIRTLREQAEAEQAEALKKTAEESAALMEEARAKAARLLEEARKQAEAEHDRLLSDVRSEIAGMVVMATEQALKKGSTADAYDRFLKAAEGGAEHEK